METILVVSSVLLWVLVLLNILLTIGLARRIRTAFPVMESLKVGQKAPNFSAKTLQGQTVTFADYDGRALALAFVSPDCKPCREELPKLRSLWPSAKQFETELIVVSDGNEEKTHVFVDGLADNLPILVAPHTNNQFFSDYKVMGTPYYYLIDGTGKVQSAGFDVSELIKKIETFSPTAKGGRE